MMLCWILITLLGSLKAQASEKNMVIYAQEGGKAILPREIQGISANVYVNWYRKKEPANELLISRNPQAGVQRKGKESLNLLDDFSLNISKVDESDFGIFICEQHVLTKTFVKTYRLYRVTIPKVPPVMVDGTLSLQCEVENSGVSTTLTWHSPENSECKQETFNSPTQTMNKVSRCHGGVWTCKVQYEGREAIATTYVPIIDLDPSPDPIYTSTSQTKTTLNIPCFLFSTVSWSDLKKNGLQGGSWSFTSLSDLNQQNAKPLLNLEIGPTVATWNVTNDTENRIKGRELKGQDLSINDLSISEKIRGKYTCSLRFGRKTLSSTVNVEVLRVFSSAGYPVHEGQRVNLTCSLGHPLPSDLTLNWTCPSSLPSCSALSPSSHPDVLYIPEVTIQHKGKWKCELWKNGKKLTHAELYLRIEKAPVDIWLCVAIGSGAVVFILLVVIIIIVIRRYRQMMMYKRRRTRFCCCKNSQQQGFYKT